MKRNILGTLAIALTCASTGAAAHGMTAAEMVVLSDARGFGNAGRAEKTGAKIAAVAVNTKVIDLSHRTPNQPAPNRAAPPAISPPAPPAINPPAPNPPASFSNVPGGYDQGATGSNGNDGKTGRVAPIVPVASQPHVTNAPEMDASSTASALTLLLGAVAVLRGRRKA